MEKNKVKEFLQAVAIVIACFIELYIIVTIFH